MAKRSSFTKWCNIVSWWMIDLSTKEVDQQQVYAFVINKALWQDKDWRWQRSDIMHLDNTSIIRVAQLFGNISIIK